MSKLVISILTFVVAVALFFVYTRPAFEQIQSIQADIRQFDQALSKARELQEVKQSLLSRYNTFSTQDLTRLRQLLPDHVDNVRLVLDLDSLAGKYGMAVQNVIISDVAGQDEEGATVLGSLGEQGRKSDSLTLQFSTAGTYDNFVNFLTDLETGLRVVDLVALTVEPLSLPPEEEASVSEPVYEYNVAVRTYWLK